MKTIRKTTCRKELTSPSNDKGETSLELCANLKETRIPQASTRTVRRRLGERGQEEAMGFLSECEKTSSVGQKPLKLNQ